MLAHLSFLATFAVAAGAPLAPQDILIQWAPNGLKSLIREMFDFLDPSHPPTQRQTVTSCLLVIFTYILVSPDVSDSKDTSSKWDAFKSRLMRLTYGLLAPEYVSMSARRQQLIASEVASSYNRAFPVENPTKKWSTAHGQYALEGGFVLWEDNKPTAILKPEVLIQMIKAGQVDAPTASKAEILANSNHFNVFTPLLIYAFMLWFCAKFPRHGFPLFSLAMLNVWLAWHAYSERNHLIQSVRQTIPVYRKPREKYGEKEQQEAREAKGNDSKSSEEEAEFPGTEFDVELQCVPSSLIKLKNNLSQRLELRCEDISTHWGNVSGYGSLAKFYFVTGFIHLPAFAITASAYITCQLLQLILSIIVNIFGACTVPMRIQCKLMCSGNADDLNKVAIGGQEDWTVSFIGWGTLLIITLVTKFTSRNEQYTWCSSIIFILIQPLILWLSAPHRRWMKKLSLGKTIKNVIFWLWCLAYFAARVAIFTIAFWPLKEAIIARP